MAASKLGEVAAALKGVSDAVRIANSLRQSQSQVIRVVKEANARAFEVANLQDKFDGYDDIKSQLVKVKQEMESLSRKGDDVLLSFRHFYEESQQFNNQVSQMLRVSGSTIPQKDLNEFCQELLRIYNMAKKFSDSFDPFVSQLGRAQQTAQTLSDSIKKVADDTQATANSRRNKAIFLGVASVGLLALAPFTGGTTAVGAAALAGAGAAVVSFSVSDLRDLASKFRQEASNLETIARDLQRNYQQAQGLQIDQEFIQSIQLALEHYKEEERRETAHRNELLQRDTEMEEKNREIEEKNRETEELRRQLAQREERSPEINIQVNNENIADDRSGAEQQNQGLRRRRRRRCRIL